MELRWYSVRTVLRHNDIGTFEERVTLWRCAAFDEAADRAMVESEEYASNLDASDCGIAQAFLISDDDAAHLDERSVGVEVFSLMRSSELDPEAYVDRFFDTGDERQRTVES